MKSRLFTLAALLMASAASGALAQNQPQIENGGPMWNAAQAAKARQAQGEQPGQPQAPEHGSHRPPQGAAPAPQPGQPPRPQPQPARQPPQLGPQGGQPNANRPNYGRPPGGDRQNWGQHGGPGRPNPGQPGPGPGQPGPDPRDRYDRDHRDWSRPNEGRGPDWDRYDRGGPPPNAQRWAPRRYPPVYNSPSRYRGAYWRPPEGFYVRSWRYGEVLPRGWYGPDYRLFDWWSFALPEPPPGYDWVRVGPDALLVDDYGRIYQVVRGVFW